MSHQVYYKHIFFRPRNLSRDVIRRYRGPKGDIREEEEDGEGGTPVYVPFRERKFSV